MQLYIIRHGETPWNAEGRLQGQTDIPLNENGIRLAKITGEALKDVPFDFAISSPLKRARQTAEIILRGTDTLVSYDERIREMNFGEGEGQKLADLSWNPALKNIDALFHAPEQYRATEKGESYEALLARVEDFLKHEILPLEGKMKRVLICCHGGIIRAFLAYIKGLEIKDFWNSHQPNCSVNILEVRDQKIRILEEHKIYYTLPEEKKGSIL